MPICLSSRRPSPYAFPSEKKFVPSGSFRDNLIAVAYYMAGK